jgi:hypothetical protein
MEERIDDTLPAKVRNAIVCTGLCTMTASRSVLTEPSCTTRSIAPTARCSSTSTRTALRLRRHPCCAYGMRHRTICSLPTYPVSSVSGTQVHHWFNAARCGSPATDRCRTTDPDALHSVTGEPAGWQDQRRTLRQQRRSCRLHKGEIRFGLNAAWTRPYRRTPGTPRRAPRAGQAHVRPSARVPR